MEPYRPYVDRVVVDVMRKHEDISELTKEIKYDLLGIPTLDVVIEGRRSPLMIAASQTTASLYRCFAGEERRIAYPII